MKSTLLVLAAWLSSTLVVSGQAPVPVVPPNPQAPTLNQPTPLGAQRGTSLELTLTGTNLAEPTGLWTSFPAKITIPTDRNNGKDNTHLRVRLEVSHDAPLGFHSLRLATRRGLSNLRLFCIDDLPQVMEVDSNRSKATPQTVPVPCVVVGHADAEIADYFKISVKAGQRLSFEVLGHRLGSALDPQLSLLDPRTGRELPGGHNNDAPGLQTDPRLTYTFKEAGDFLIEVRDTLWRGGNDFWYRLRIGDFPCATTPMPMAARRGSQVLVHFAGPMVEGVAPIEVSVLDDPGTSAIWLAPRGANGLYGWPVALAVSDHEETVEQEPNNDPAHANRVPVPGGISARFLEPNDADHFVFAAQKGQRYVIDAHSVELNSPTEVYMVLKDAKGQQLAATNPMTAPHLDFTAAADGDYYLVVEHLLYAYGPSETYRITIAPYEPGFALAVGIGRFDVPPGGSLPISIFATRRDYAGPIDVSVVGHPDFSGHATIAAGQPPAPNQPAVTLFLSARPETPPGPYNIRLRGSAVVGGQTLIHDVNLRTLLSQEFGGLTYPPPQLYSQVGVAALAKPPFTLAARFDHAEASPGLPAPVTITATRAAGFLDEIALEPVGLPPNVAPALKNIAKRQNEIQVQLNPAANAPLGTFSISFMGKAKFQNRDFSFTVQPISLVVTLPFELHVEPAAVTLPPGGKAKIKVTAVRRAGYQGPVAVELRNLPANVSAAKGTIAAGQSSLEIELAAAANAAPVSKTDVHVQGTAPQAANQQNASPNFVVSVIKK
jgi:hypothetical protein